MSLTATITEALRLRDKMRADGASGDELDRGFEKVLREVWPQNREWKYLCETCRDYGLDMKTCPGDATCGRPKIHAPHEYGVPCWCEAGRRYQPKAQTEDTTDAGKRTRKQTRWGR